VRVRKLQEDSYWCSRSSWYSLSISMSQWQFEDQSR